MNWQTIKILSFIALSLLLYLAIKQNIKLNNQLEIAINNEKAYALQNSELSEKNLAFKLTIDQLTFYNDSLMMTIKKVANDNGIKDKNIKSLQYQLEHYNKVDTLILRDTIFRDSNFVLDTCVVDQWSKTCLHFKYPSNISVEHSYKNDKYIIVNHKKEPIKPRKWFLPRLFTKKHTVAEITVIDKNPYIETKQQTFIEII